MPLSHLPIFPLGVVLYPGTALPLHLFEPRYRQMLADVRAGDSRFGILTSLSGVPERDLPRGRMGCVAEVTDVEMMPDGRANIVVQGRERFALEAFVAS
ncbi:MAG: LON peptidase substrate-binding domain-containing protein, partial [bacterium]